MKSRGPSRMPGMRAGLFERVMVEELQRWIDLADERMSEYGIDVFVMPGNDDPWSCDAVIAEAAHVTACDERVVWVGDHEMISCAYANPTPWNSPRELDEDALYTKLRGLAEQVESPATAIFNLHVPPHNSGLDTANEMNPTSRSSSRAGSRTRSRSAAPPSVRSSRSTSRCWPCTDTSTSRAGRRA